MHVLFAAECWPHPGHDELSVNQVVYELIRAFRQMGGCRVSFVSAYRSDRTPSDDSMRRSRAALAEIGVGALPSIELPSAPAVNRWRTLLLPRPQDVFPEATHRARANALVREIEADVVIVPWAERATQLFAEADCCRVAYYGDPDPQLLRITALPPVAPSRGVLRDLITRLRVANVERLHLREMRRYDLLGDVAANGAEYYRGAGIQGAFYSRMVFVDRAPADVFAMRDRLEAKTPYRIVANIGSQASTGNVLGLNYLADHLLDRLDRRLGPQYELVLAGGGRLDPLLATKLDHPRIVNLGFVDDIDGLLLGTPVFLCLNNATPYKFNQSRYLHAWSLGCCVIAHRDAALSLPEMADGKNTLLGADPDEIVTLIGNAFMSKELRRRVGEAGRETFLANFNGNAVARDLMQRIRDCLGLRLSPTENDPSARF